MVLRVCTETDADGMPMISWHRGSAYLSSGRTWPGRKFCRRGRIHVTAGSNTRDQRLVLLHELAHWLLPPGEHHSERFWTLAFLLYRRYGVPLRYAEQRERDYRVGAVKAAKVARTRGRHAALR